MSEKQFYGKALLLPTLIYAAVFTLFRYNNYSSYTMLLQVLTTGVYYVTCFKRLGREFKKSGYLYLSLMGLLALSDFLTANAFVIFCNNFGIILLTIVLLISQFYDTSRWSLGKGMLSILEAVFGGICHLGAPFSDFAGRKGEEDPLSDEVKKTSPIIYCLIGVGITIPILLVLIPLLSSADLVFAELVKHLVIDLDFTTVFLIGLLFVFTYLASYCLLRAICKQEIAPVENDHRHLEPTIAITILSIVGIVYLLFSGIQIIYLFLGNLTLPADYTYAEYAREGFFQLLFVCFLNLIAVLVITDIFRPHKAIQLMLTVISFCTYIMLASSALRMCMYIAAYSLTVLRVLVLWALAVLALLLGGIIAYIYHKNFPLWRYCFAVFTVFWMLLSFSHMDYWIAKYDYAYGDDPYYLSELSLDAAPVVGEILEEHPVYATFRNYENYLEKIDYLTDEPDEMDFWHFNLSRYTARQVLIHRSNQ